MRIRFYGGCWDMKVRQVHSLLEVLQVAKPLPPACVASDGPAEVAVVMEIEQYRLKCSRDGTLYYEIIS